VHLPSRGSPPCTSVRNRPALGMSKSFIGNVPKSVTRGSGHVDHGNSIAVMAGECAKIKRTTRTRKLMCDAHIKPSARSLGPIALTVGGDSGPSGALRVPGVSTDAIFGKAGTGQFRRPPAEEPRRAMAESLVTITAPRALLCRRATSARGFSTASVVVSRHGTLRPRRTLPP